MSSFDFGKNFLEEQILTKEILEKRILSEELPLEELIAYIDTLSSPVDQELKNLVSQMRKFRLSPEDKASLEQVHPKNESSSKVVGNIKEAALPQHEAHLDIHVYDEWIEDDEYDAGGWYTNRTFSPRVEEEAEKLENSLIHLEGDIFEDENSSKDNEDAYSYTPSYEGVQVVLPDNGLADQLGISKYDVNKDLAEDTFPYQYVAEIVEKVHNEEKKEQVRNAANTKPVSLETAPSSDSEIKGELISTQAETHTDNDSPLIKDLDHYADDILMKEELLPPLSQPSRQVEETVDTVLAKEEEGLHKGKMSKEQDDISILGKDMSPNSSFNEKDWGTEPAKDGGNKLMNDNSSSEDQDFVEPDIIAEHQEEDADAIAEVIDLRDDPEVPEDQEDEGTQEALIHLTTMNFDTPMSIPTRHAENVAPAVIDEEHEEDPVELALPEKEKETLLNEEKETSTTAEEKVEESSLKTHEEVSAQPVAKSSGKKYWWENAPPLECAEEEDFGTFMLYRDLG